jgi:fucose permease
MNIALNVNTRIYRIAISAFFFVAGLTFATWASRIPDIKTKMHLSDAGLGLILFALPVGQIVSLPISAALVSRFGSKTLIIVGALLYPLTLVLLATSSTTLLLALSLFVFGLWANLLNIAMNTQAVAVENIYGRSIMASFHGVWSMAGFTGALLGTLFVSAALSPLIHFSIVCMVTGLVVWAAHKHTVPSDSRNDSGQKQPLFVRPDKRILILGLIAFCCMVCEGAMADWSGVYYQKVVQSPEALTTIGYVAFMSTMATGRFVGDWLVTKFGVVRIFKISGILIASGLLTTVILPNIIAATIGFLLVGFGVSSVVPIAFGLAGKSTNMSPSAALAAVSTISFLGFLIGPPVIGFIAELSSLRISFIVIALLGFGTTLLAAKTKNIG